MFQLSNRTKKGGQNSKDNTRFIFSSLFNLMNFIIVFALFTFISTAAEARIKHVKPNLLETTDDKIKVEFEFDNFIANQINIDGRNYAKINIEGEAEIMEAGLPALPTVSRSVIIPDDMDVDIKVVDSSYYEIEGIDIIPSRGFILRNVNPDDVPYSFDNVYDKDEFFPGQLAKLGKPYVIRDYRGIVITATPFQYNPVRHVLRVYKRITVEVFTTGRIRENAKNHINRKHFKNKAFQEVYKRQFINYDSRADIQPGALATNGSQGDMLIIVNDPWVSNVQPLADHKNSIGISTTIVPVSTIGNNSTNIKNYIQSFYNTSELAYVLLVGDAAQVATPTASGGSSDPTYSKLAGSDDYPDIFVGRFSAESAGDVDTQVQRTIEYENMPATQQDWFWRGTGIASPEGDSTTGDDGESDQQHIEGLRQVLLSANYTVVDQIYEAAGATAADITNALNAGRGIMNYCGHGSTTAWGTTGFSVTNVNALANQNKLPFIFDVACVNGQFNGYTCFAEAWMRAVNGGEPTGAIGIYASSINQSWAPPMEAQDTFNSLYTTGTYTTYGVLCYAASCSMMDKYGSGGVDMFNTWHIFADPSLRVVMAVESDDTIARKPSPADKATGADLNVDLGWTPGIYASSHDMYFGMDYNTVLNADHLSGEFKGNQPIDNNSFDPGTLDYSTTYYWAIDEINEANIWPGNVWKFTTVAASTPPTFVAAGAVASGTGAITPALPSGITTGDILLLFLETSNQAISISNSNGGTWTAVTNSPQSTGTAAGTTGVRLTVFWSRYNGAQGAPTISDSGNHQLGRIIAVRGAVASGNPWDVTAGGVEAVADTSGSIPGATTTVDNTLVVAAIATALPDSSTTSNFSSWTNSNLTGLTERTDNTVTAGNGGGLGIVTGTKATAGAYGNTAVTAASSAYKGMISIAIKPEASGSPVSPPAQATNPIPANSATNVGLTTGLSWTAGADATSHDIYFGTVNPPPFIVNQTGLTYDTGTMSANATYYWRIDEKNVSGTTAGAVWSFTTTDVAPPVVILQDGFESNFDKWTDGGTTDWDRATSQKHAGSYSAHAGSSDNDLFSDNLNTAGKTSITIDFWFRDDDIDNDDDIYLQLYNGSAYNNYYELGNSTEDTWNHYTVTITDSQYMRSNFRIKFEGTSIDSGENLWIDDVTVSAQ